MRLSILRGDAAPRRFAVRAQLTPEVLESRQLLSTIDPGGLVAAPSIDAISGPARRGSPPPSAPYGPLQIRNAYGINQIPAIQENGTTRSVDGSGQTIAIVDAYDDPNIAADLDTFDTKFSLPS